MPNRPPRHRATPNPKVTTQTGENGRQKAEFTTPTGARYRSTAPPTPGTPDTPLSPAESWLNHALIHTRLA